MHVCCLFLHLFDLPCPALDSISNNNVVVLHKKARKIINLWLGEQRGDDTMSVRRVQQVQGPRVLVGANPLHDA
jgi:hypothetical protein